MTLNRFIALGLTAAAVLGSTWWLSRGTHPALFNLPPVATGPWVAFGDSLTAGYGAGKGSDYPSELGRQLGVSIVNHGRNGDTSAAALARLEQVARVHPRVALVCLGGNDALSQTPIEDTISNLREILRRLQKEGTFVVLIGIRSASLLDRNDDHFEKLARETGALYVEDFLQGLAFKPIYMTDAIHPNAEGYRRFAERLAKELRPHLPLLLGEPTAR